MEIIIIIFIIFAVIAKSGVTGLLDTQVVDERTNAENVRPDRSSTYNRPNYQTSGNTSNTSVTRGYSSSQEKPWEKAARENIEAAARRATQIANKALNNLFEEDAVSSPETGDMSAAERIRARRMEEKTTTILQRAKGNANENKEDVTLNTMEEEHAHSERVSAAEHHHPEDIIPENMLGSVEDLMIKGYDGNLCFERDFVGEGLDMISRFTVPSEIPEYKNEHIA